MTEAYEFSNHIIAVALLLYYWHLIRTWCQPPPPERRDETVGGKSAASPASSFTALATRQPGRYSGNAALPSSPAPAVPREDGLAAIRKSDAGFDEAAFLVGAALAYERVVDAFAAGDIAAVEGLLDPAVRCEFDGAISARRERGERRDFTLIGLKETRIVGAAATAGLAEISVRFTGEASSASWSADGSLLCGSPEQVVETADVWTFSRPLAARNPNWIVVATEGEGE
jgi:predicted lipid-binding transport protein (Tim44 family)